MRRTAGKPARKGIKRVASLSLPPVRMRNSLLSSFAKLVEEGENPIRLSAEKTNFFWPKFLPKVPIFNNFSFPVRSSKGTEET